MTRYRTSALWLLTLLLSFVSLSSEGAPNASPVESVERLIHLSDVYKGLWEFAIESELRAYAELEQYEDEPPQKLFYFLGLCYFYRGTIVDTKTEDIVEAKRNFEYFLSRAKDSKKPPDAYFYLGQLWSEACAYKLGGEEIRQHPMKISDPRMAVRVNSEFGRILATVGLRLEQAQKYASVDFKKLSQVEENTDPYYANFAYVTLQQSELDAAREAIKGITNRPVYIEPYREIPVVPVAGVPKDAIKPLVIDEKFFDPITLYNRHLYFLQRAAAVCKDADIEATKKDYFFGVIHRREGSLKTAVSNLQQVIGNADAEAILRLRGRIELGRCYYLMGDSATADKAWHQVETSANADALTELGLTYADMGIKPQKAVELCRQAIKLDNQDRDTFLWNLTWAYFKNEQYRDALKTHEKVYTVETKHLLSAHDHLHLIRLSMIYYTAKKYAELKFYMYLPGKMLPRIYPESIQIFHAINSLHLFGETGIDDDNYIVK